MKTLLISVSTITATSLVLFFSNKAWIIANKDLVAIAISTIASISSLSAILFSIFIYLRDKNQQVVKIGFDASKAFYDIANDSWIVFRINNYGSIAAINPKIDVYMVKDDTFEHAYSDRYVYSMLPDHYFEFFFDDNLPKLHADNSLLIKVSYTNSNTGKDESQLLTIVLRKIIHANISNGERRELKALVPLCVKYDYHQKLVNKFNAR